MDDFLLWFIVAILILPCILYFIVRAAVKEGTYEALVEYDKYKKQEHLD